MPSPGVGPALLPERDHHAVPRLKLDQAQALFQLWKAHVEGQSPAPARPRHRARPSSPPRPPKGALIVVDAPNVCMAHGHNHTFSVEGLALCLAFWQSQGHGVIAFLPDKHVDERRLAQCPGLRPGMLALQSWVDEGLVALTPSGDYDDSYCIAYAKAKGGFIVSNDKFRDHRKGDRKAHAWIQRHRIPFSFVHDNFVPHHPWRDGE